MKRVAGLDIIRSIAILFVISVHFLLNTNFYSFEQKSGYGMIILSFIRHLLLICVPLFIILTGYLNKNKEPNKEYFKGLKKVIISYLFIAIISILIRKYYLHEERDLIYWILSPFSFRANGYSWYIEMYIGLYLIAPFINIMYKNIKTKEQKNLLVIVLIILTSIPSITNGYKLQGISFNIIPDYWINFYPITYYVLGLYISEYQPSISRKKSIIYSIIILLIQTFANYIPNHNVTFNKNIFGKNYNILTLMLAVIVFLSLYKKEINNNKIKKIITTISTISLDMYLFSYIVDLKVYEIIKPQLNTPKEHLLYMVPTISVVFISCFILSYIKKIIFNYIERKQNNQKT